MRIGKMRHRITIVQPKSTSRSTDGAPVFTESTILKDIWCAIKPSGGKEVFRDDYRWSVSDKIFTIRYTTATLTPAMVIRYSSEDYEIQAVTPVDERKYYIDIVGRKTT